MKCLALLVILVSVGGYFCDIDEAEKGCYKEIRKCFSPLPFKAPESSEELLKLCRRFEELGVCIIDVREEAEVCQEVDYNADFVQHIRSGVDYLKSNCQEDNPTFEVISNNLHCIVRVMKMDFRPCVDIMREKKSELLETHFPSYRNNTQFYMCLSDRMYTACEIQPYGYYCGENVRDAVEEVFSNIDYKRLECTAEQLEELERVHEILKDVVIQELALRDVFERKRK